ncbi:hypothetical protein [Amycolatopsis sp. FDAARGOS 1241]|uniref:hypothetical protein n=1 Tax=Amycolatopsis sp. FDAARGOS 1241 TaxID=2778070 RepID=UPI00194E8DD4|nr:hypothetical protein [Amycolatopsis sp. FDAARGOS 1241]QRP47478.1 hypothetical protein I6J71_05830 [Amycolatopsis sp. FDAARGOS 1241]
MRKGLYLAGAVTGLAMVASAAPALADTADVVFYSGAGLSGVREVPETGTHDECLPTAQRNTSAVNYSANSILLYSGPNCTGSEFALGSLHQANTVYGGFVSYRVVQAF